jgi:hypothetical protein
MPKCFHCCDGGVVVVALVVAVDAAPAAAGANAVTLSMFDRLVERRSRLRVARVVDESARSCAISCSTSPCSMTYRLHYGSVIARTSACVSVPFSLCMHQQFVNGKRQQSASEHVCAHSITSHSIAHISHTTQQLARRFALDHQCHR